MIQQSLRKEFAQTIVPGTKRKQLTRHAVGLSSKKLTASASEQQKKEFLSIANKLLQKQQSKSVNREELLPPAAGSRNHSAPGSQQQSLRFMSADNVKNDKKQNKVVDKQQFTPNLVMMKPYKAATPRRPSAVCKQQSLRNFTQQHHQASTGTN